MPCFDKKLEASRSDFYNDLFNTRDVDCVITSSKVSFSSTNTYTVTLAFTLGVKEKLLHVPNVCGAQFCFPLVNS